MDARRAALVVFLMAVPAVAAEDPVKVLVTVNGAKITGGDLEFAFLSRRVPAEERPQVRERILSQLIDRRLMAEFLESRSAKANPDDVRNEIDRINDQIRKAGDDPAKVLPKLGYTEARLRNELSLPLAWTMHARRAITDTQLREFWETHREEFDGTQIRAAQIFLKVPANDDAAWQSAEEKLKTLRSEIESGKLTFAEAAEKQSQSPSGKMGGDVGFFPYRGKMPPQFAQTAFALKKGELSQPFRTPFGAHLITVTDRKPGDLSLEDVRLRVFERLQQDLWDEIVRDLRAKAKIEQ